MPAPNSGFIFLLSAVGALLLGLWSAAELISVEKKRTIPLLSLSTSGENCRFSTRTEASSGLSLVSLEHEASDSQALIASNPMGQVLRAEMKLGEFIISLDGARELNLQVILPSAEERLYRLEGPISLENDQNSISLFLKPPASLRASNTPLALRSAQAMELFKLIEQQMSACSFKFSGGHGEEGID